MPEAYTKGFYVDHELDFILHSKRRLFITIMSPSNF